MVYRFEFRPYHRPFRHPLMTRHGTWTVRNGIILRLTDDQGLQAYGEIAPLPWFGSETFEQALNFCTQLPTHLTKSTLFSILPTLPACQFGFETAYANLIRPPDLSPLPPERCSVLLPPGEAALAAWPQHWALGHRTFKTKIGIAPVADELQWLTLLINQLPLGGKLRLDANGGLDELSAHRWLDWCDRINPIGASHEGQRIEYLEQPLPPAQFLALLRLSQRYQTPIALDESVSTLEQLKAHYYRGWRSLYVIKAAIIGSPSRLKQFCQHYPIDFVISSVFETVIGRQAAIDLAADLATSASQRALGLGTQQWFDDLNQSDGAALWQQL